MSTKKPNKSGSTPADFELSLEATLEQQQRLLPPGKRQSKGRADVDGYNPYDAVPAVKSADAKPVDAKRKGKPIDLRKLSEWIRAQRQVEALKKEKA